jgi:hypothetical protein
MQLGIGPHLQETELEQYSMGTLPPARIQPFEEHVLVCESCQDQLLEMEAYINAVRSVSPKLRATKRFPWPRLAWATAAMAAVASMLMVSRVPATGGGTEVAVVRLQASRGIDGIAEANAAARQPVSLEIDLSQIPADASYRLEIVDATGKREGEAVAAPQGGRIVHALNRGLPAGRHYVRLYASSGVLLREFALLLKNPPL